MYKRLLNILAVLCPLAVVYYGALNQNKQSKDIKKLWKNIYIGFSFNTVVILAIWI